MAEVTRIRAVWTGLPSGAAYTSFHFAGGLDDAPLTAAAAAVRAFFDGFKGDLASTWRIAIESNASVFDDSSGNKSDEPPIAAKPADVVGTAVGQKVASGVGACITWRTGVYTGGRPVLGRTFLVPLVVSAYDTDGTLNPGLITALTNAANTFRTTPNVVPVVWQRKDGLLPDFTRLNPITGSSVSDRVAVLRSRR